MNASQAPVAREITKGKMQEAVSIYKICLQTTSGAAKKTEVGN